MARMSDEAWEYIQDSKDKKITARSARHTRTHCGKSGAVKLPSDYMTKKELKAMNGECKSYRMNEPMTYNEFKDLPDDLKIEYIKALRKKFHVPDKHIAAMLGVARSTIVPYMKKLGLAKGSNGHGDGVHWDRDGWYAWCNGVKLETEVKPDEEEIPVEEDIREEVVEETACEPLNNENVCENAHDCMTKRIRDAGPIAFAGNRIPVIPKSGEMSFAGNRAEDILQTMKVLLSNARVNVHIAWEIDETTETM